MAIGFRAPALLASKALIIGAIVLALLIPLTMLRGLVSERTALREQANTKVAQGWGGDLVVGGPMLVIPTLRTVADGEKSRVERDELYLLPLQLDVSVDLNLEEKPRYVGIYAVPVYLAAVRMKGEFDFTAIEPLLNRPGVTVLWDESRIRLPLSEVRSLREIRLASFGQQSISFGPASSGLYRGVEAVVGASGVAAAGPVAFAFDTVIAGSRNFSVLPVGSTTTVSVHSDWPHPSFQGAFLPVEHKIDAHGFDARWQVLELNRSYAQAWMGCDMSEERLLGSSLGVGLYQTVDVYQRGERAIKYALLFIALTFLTFFAWEQVSRSRLHPFQYLLVGLALSVFYLLLIALSEHIAYALAYLTAATALILLIGIYIAGAFGNRLRGVVAGAAMTIVYGVLYMLVLSEDYALLLGAIMLFIALAAVMLATRKIDWYRAAEPVDD
jgi:inner membrane protein